MQTVKNAAGKTICRVDKLRREIEIVHKGYRSLVWFDCLGRFHQRHDQIQHASRRPAGR